MKPALKLALAIGALALSFGSAGGAESQAKVSPR